MTAWASLHAVATRQADGIVASDAPNCARKPLKNWLEIA
jgi:hypothetical protein